MKPIRWTPHALKNLTDREVPRSEADRALEEPELVTAGGLPRKVFMRRYFDLRHNQEMLVRVVVEESPEESVVVTVYITSNIGKYMRGA